MDRFNKDFETVAWLNAYDAVAWWTSDSVMTNPSELTSQLGPEWFCFPDSAGLWHATYGKFSLEKYESLLHYKVGFDGQVSKCDEAVPVQFAVPFSKAINHAYEAFEAVEMEVKVRMNHYVRLLPNSTIEVWMLPAFSTDGSAIFGNEFCFTFESTGEQLLSKYEKNGRLMGFKPDTAREIIIFSPDPEHPSVGSIFFAWYYKDYFKQIIIETNKSRSMPFKVEDGWTWIHADSSAKD